MDTELLYKAFQASPDAILISRLDDGRFAEVNDGFSRRQDIHARRLYPVPQCNWESGSIRRIVKKLSQLYGKTNEFKIMQSISVKRVVRL